MDQPALQVVKKTPLHDPDAESTVISLCMTSDKAWADAVELLTTEDFYAPANRLIWAAVVQLAEECKPPALLVLQDRLRTLGVLQQVDPTYLAQLAAFPPANVQAKEAIDIVIRHAQKRRVAAAAARLHEAATDPMCTPEKLAELVTDVTDVTNVTDVTEVTDVTDVVRCHKASQAVRDVTGGGRPNYGGMADRVDRFIKSNPDAGFTIQELYAGCDAKTGKEQASIRQIVARMSQKMSLLKRGREYSLVTNSFKRVDVTELIKHQAGEFPLRLPLDLDKACLVQPKNLIVIAGQSSAGKTAFLMNIAMTNHDQPWGKPHYCMSEMGPDELNYRFKFMPPEFVQRFANCVEVFSGENNFNSHILLNNRNGLIICDYIKADGDDFIYVSKWLDDIHMALHGGVAVAAIQKMAGKSHGVGGGHTESKSRLYITLDKFGTEQGLLYKAKIIKAKFPRPYNGQIRTLDGMECLYNVKDGWDIQKIHKWARYDQKEWEAVAAEYWAANGGDAPW